MFPPPALSFPSPLSLRSALVAVYSPSAGSADHPPHRLELVALVALGCSYKAVASIYGVPIVTIHRWVQTDLLNPPSRVQALSDARRRAIISEIDAGVYSLREIARRHRVAHRTVANIRSAITLGGVAPRPHRCGSCRALIVTKRCVLCECL